ncbi:MAG: bifunctional 3-deoxy-7-phosphoheptulonate synthase/chorismate mutase type II [Bacteroidales bacterium]|nr:bifunctional 3-deoxy-7-phosphoheptulonate synthase/chorismate mutase type II [Bacteroidales bacterium]
MTTTIKTLHEWGLGNGERPLLISGPCSAETSTQMLTTANELQEAGIGIFRAGIWKPRTRPGAFEGVGSKGLRWMQRVKSETGMKTATEVANVRHVDSVMGAGLDMIWIGARTTANPFAVQEIAEALKGTDIPVFVKNPVNPDVDLWVGAIERLQTVGIKKIGAIHRGFSAYETSIYRNPPMWQVPIELKRRMPGLPLLCDPSHIAGKRNLLQSIAQKAMDLNFDGLMIESHCNPDEAWSDKNQQLTPADLKVLLNSLVIRQVTPEGASAETLEELRSQISFLDDEMLDIMQKRMEVAKAIGRYKKENNMTILQPKRWEDIIESSLKKGDERNLSHRFIDKMLKAIHEESISKQTDIMNEGMEDQ